MSIRTTFPFKNFTKTRSADSAATIKFSVVYLFFGYTFYILFFETLVMILNIDINQTMNLMMSELSGFPEIDILLPLILISITPYQYLQTNLFLFGISLIPWFFAGLITGMLFGPQYDRMILITPPVFLLGLTTLFSFLLYSLFGFGLSFPIIDLAILAVFLLMSVFSIAMMVFTICLPLIIPAFIGYSVGRKHTIRPVIPRVFLAQPDRIDSNHTRCRFLTDQDKCSVAEHRKEIKMIPNICNNKYFTPTCRYFFTEKKRVKEGAISLDGGFIDEIQ